jgi:hypothetical protein
MDTKNVYLGAFCIIVGAAFIVFSSALDVMPALFPMIVAILLLGLGVVSLGTQVVLLIGKRSAREAFGKSIRESDPGASLRLLPPLVVAFLYAFLLKRLGFVIITPILIFVTAYYFGYRRKVRLILVSIGFTGILYLLFGLFLRVPFPLFPRGF